VKLEVEDHAAMVTMAVKHSEFQNVIRQYLGDTYCASCFCYIEANHLICDDCLELAHQARRDA